jgi:hypothetical protein
MVSCILVYDEHDKNILLVVLDERECEERRWGARLLGRFTEISYVDIDV